MSPKKQRIAIAEACGWHFREVTPGQWKPFIGESLSTSDNSDWDYSYYPDKETALQNFDKIIPDYLSELNAMHNAEKTIPDDLQQKYCIELCYLTDVHPMDYGPCNGYGIVHATAAQRAEAFLRTIGKWEDE